MMTSSNENIYRVTGPLWGEFTGHRWTPLTNASDVELWCVLHLNKRLSKPSRRRWFETPWLSLWRHCNDLRVIKIATLYSFVRHARLNSHLFYHTFIFMHHLHSIRDVDYTKKSLVLWTPGRFSFTCHYGYVTMGTIASQITSFMYTEGKNHMQLCLFRMWRMTSADPWWPLSILTTLLPAAGWWISSTQDQRWSIYTGSLWDRTNWHVDYNVA